MGVNTAAADAKEAVISSGVIVELVSRSCNVQWEGQCGEFDGIAQRRGMAR